MWTGFCKVHDSCTVRIMIHSFSSLRSLSQSFSSIYFVFLFFFFRFYFKTSKYSSNAGFQCRFQFQWPYNRCLAFKHAHNKITMRNINPIESITFIHFDMQLGHRAQCIPFNEYKLREWHSEGVSIALCDLCAMPFCAVHVLCIVSNVYFKYAH